MNTQNQIKRTLSEPAAIEDVRQLLAGNEFTNRTHAAEFICQRFGFCDARGHPQLGGCLKALRELEAAGHWTLPAACYTPGRRSPRRLSEPLAPPREVPAQVSEVRDLALGLVDTTEHMRIWNELMITEHPRGAGPLVGRQLRYLIDSQHGWLGGLGFAAPALQLAERDRWIGWDVGQRRAYLHTVVGMSRFLIRPSVQCRNLASKILSLSLAQLPGDFQHQYGYAPWLVESFVGSERYSGACCRAANWIWVGRTQGRGRQDRFRHASESVKDIYLHPLQNDFRARMGLPADAGLGALGLAAGLENDTWAGHEFGGAPLGDARLSKRLVRVAAAKAEQPDRAFSGVAKGDWAAVKGYYRLIDMPEASAVSMANILAPHRERTVRRMKGQKTVLCIQDGSDLDYRHLATCEGLGVIGSNQTSAQTRGLHLHSTLALTPNGLPLGVLMAQCVAPKPKSPQDDRPAFAIPIEEKKTFCWIEHHRDLVDLCAAMPHTRLIDVCDREADFFELFDEQRRTGCVELLVRAKYNRNITEDPFQLFPAVRQAPVQSRVRVVVPRQSARPKRSKQKARSKRPGRTATLAVRYTRVQLRPAHYHKDKCLPWTCG